LSKLRQSEYKRRYNQTIKFTTFRQIQAPAKNFCSGLFYFPILAVPRTAIPQYCGMKAELSFSGFFKRMTDAPIGEYFKQPPRSLSLAPLLRKEGIATTVILPFRRGGLRQQSEGGVVVKNTNYNHPAPM
jgi:hypothetical protein